MAASALKQETYLPEPDSRLVEVFNFLQAHDGGRPRYFLSGSAPGDRVELPAEVHRLLRQVVGALQQGLAVTVAPSTKTLTTQQAAELLGVSRPTVVKLLNEKQIPFERAGTHRRILLRDLLDYRERRRAEQYAALETTAVDLGDEEDVDEALQHLRAARRAVGDRRRGRSKPS